MHTNICNINANIAYAHGHQHRGGEDDKDLLPCGCAWSLVFAFKHKHNTLRGAPDHIGVLPSGRQHILDIIKIYAAICI